MQRPWGRLVMKGGQGKAHSDQHSPQQRKGIYIEAGVVDEGLGINV